MNAKEKLVAEIKRLEAEMAKLVYGSYEWEMLRFDVRQACFNLRRA